MKRIDITKMLKDNELDNIDRREILGMEFIKQTNGTYLIKNSNGRVVSEKEKLQLENNELVLEDIKSNQCQQETTKKIAKNKKRVKEIEKTESEKETVDEVIEETDTTL